MGNEIDAKDDVLAGLREEAELSAREANRLKLKLATARKDRTELENELRCWKITSDNTVAAVAAIKEMILRHGQSLEDIRIKTLARLQHELDNLITGSEMLQEAVKHCCVNYAFSNNI